MAVNRFAGSATYSLQPEEWNQDNTRGGAHPGGLPNFEAINQWDVSLGGPVLKDKMWFFSSYRYSDIVNGISRTAQDLAFLTAFRPDFQPFNATSNSHQPFVKVTTQLIRSTSCRGSFSTTAGER